jgi:hypothetical protein
MLTETDPILYYAPVVRTCCEYIYKIEGTFVGMIEVCMSMFLLVCSGPYKTIR